MRTSLIAALLWGTVCGVASASPLPVDETVRVGRPPRPVAVRVEATEDGARLTLGRGPGASEHVLPLRTAREATVESVPLGGGGTVAIVRVDGEGRAAALVAGRVRPEVVWIGRLDAHGDPGERRRDVLEIADRTGDGQADVIVGTISEATRICGQTETILAPRAIDPRSLALRPVALRRLPEGNDQVELTAAADSPGPGGAPLIAAVHFTNASSSAGASDDPSLVPAPVSLSDGEPATAWREGAGGDGRWEFATARLAAGRHRVRAFAITVAPTAAGSAPKRLWLVGDEGPRLYVRIPEELARRPGARMWIVPPAPLAWSCVSVVLDEAWPGEGGVTAIAEVEAYTDLDFGEGVDALLEELVADGDRGAEAARLLATLGPPAVERVGEAWETLTPTGRRRSIRVFADNAREVDGARAALVRAARDEDADVRHDALSALVAAGDVAVADLASLATDETAGDDAAVALARLAPEAAVAHLLDALAQGGSERPALRRAIRTAAQRGGEAARARIAAWVEAGPPVTAGAAAALALTGAPEARESAAALVRRGMSGAERFEDRWRLVGAAKQLERDAPVDAWLARTAREADEWMLRAAALEALAARDPEAAREVARAAMEDDYPRVRVAAIGVLGDDETTVEPIATLARRDRWSMVRAAAVTALADDAAALPVLRAAVEDDARAVRTAAVGALRTAGDRASWQRVSARLEDEDEWPEVIQAGIEYARELCIRELAEPIAGILRRGMRPEAWAPDVDMAVIAVDALAALGGGEAETMLDRAESESAPPAIRAAAARARRTVRECR